MNDMSMSAIQAASNTPAIVVFGRDGSGKPHASVFIETDAEQAEKAAGLMGMHVLRIETAEARELAAKLPQGRVFASGRAFVPFVKPGLYGSLAAIAQVDPHQGPGKPEPAPAASAGPPKAGDNEAGSPPESQPVPEPDALVAGTVVLAFEGPGMGCWEAVVLRAQGNVITLRWRDYPDMGHIARRRDHLAYLPPGMEPG